MKNRKYGSLVSDSQAAEICNFTVEVLRYLTSCRQGPARLNRPGILKLRTSEVEAFAQAYPDPNVCLSEIDVEPMFVRHSDGKWWVKRDYEQAQRSKIPHYYDGSACEQGHVCERYTESKQCVECAKIEGSGDSES